MDEKTLRKLAYSTDPNDRIFAAQDKQLPRNLAHMLAADANPKVVCALLTGNAVIDEVLVEHLSAHLDPKVRATVATFSKKPEHVMVRLAADDCDEVAENILTSGRSLSKEVVEILNIRSTPIIDEYLEERDLLMDFSGQFSEADLVGRVVEDEMRTDYLNWMTYEQISKKHGVSISTVLRKKKNGRWERRK